MRWEHGRITGEIVENSMARRPAELVLTIEARGGAGEQLTLSIRELAMRKWSDLENRQLSYSAEKITGYADGDEIEIGERATGSLHSGGKTYDVRATGLSFGQITGTGIAVRIEVEGMNVVPLSVDAVLEIGGIRVRGDIAKVRPIEREAALGMASRLLDLEAFEANGGEAVSLLPKVARPAST